MPWSADDPGIPIALACDLAGVSRQVRATWIERNLVLGDTRGACDLAQVIDLGCFAELVDRLGFDDARLVWPAVAASVRERPGGRLDLVVDLELKSAVAARSDSDVAAACRHGRLVRVVRLENRIVEVSTAYERLIRTLAATERRRRGGT